jgi:hypothetical protein
VTGPWSPAAHSQVLAALAAEFPGWEIRPAWWGQWSAWWRSEDGRSRRYIVKGSAAELLAELRVISS